MFRNWAGTRETKSSSQYLKIRAVVWNEVLNWRAANSWKPTCRSCDWGNIGFPSEAKVGRLKSVSPPSSGLSPFLHHFPFLSIGPLAQYSCFPEWTHRLLLAALQSQGRTEKWDYLLSDSGGDLVLVSTPLKYWIILEDAEAYSKQKYENYVCFGIGRTLN